MYSIYDIEIKCNFYGKPYASHASNCSYSPHARSVRDHKSYVCAYMSSNATPSVYRQERVSISLQCVVAWSITSGEAADCAGCSSDTVYPVIRPACRIASRIAKTITTPRIVIPVHGRHKTTSRFTHRVTRQKVTPSTDAEIFFSLRFDTYR